MLTTTLSETQEIPQSVENEPSITIRVIDKDRPAFLAAVYLLGASLRHLATMYGVTHPTILQSIRRRLPAGTIRLGSDMKLEHITEYRKVYYDNLVDVRSLTPHEAAQWLLDNTKLDTDNDNSPLAWTAGTTRDVD